MSEFLTTKELAAKLGCSPWRIYDAVKQSRIPYRRFTDRGKILFDLAEIRAALFPPHLQKLFPQLHPKVPRNKSEELALQQRRKQVAELYLRGQTQWQIAHPS